MTTVYNYFALPPVRAGFCQSALAVCASRRSRNAEIRSDHVRHAPISPHWRGRSTMFFTAYEAYQRDSAAWDAQYGPRYGASQPGYLAVQAAARRSTMVATGGGERCRRRRPRPGSRDGRRDRPGNRRADPGHPGHAGADLGPGRPAGGQGRAQGAHNRPSSRAPFARGALAARADASADGESTWNGAVAQLGERVVRNDEVRGSIPLGSTRFLIRSKTWFVCLPHASGARIPRSCDLLSRRCGRPVGLADRPGPIYRPNFMGCAGPGCDHQPASANARPQARKGRG